DDVHQERARFHEAQVEVEPWEVTQDRRLYDVARLTQCLPDDGDITDLGDEGAAFKIHRHPEFEILTTPKVQLEHVAAAADVLVRIDGLLKSERRYNTARI